MSRPIALALVLLVLILTSQTEWSQQPKIEPESPPKVQHASSTNHQFKEQIIFLQEKQIHTLTELVKSLKSQLSLCQESLNETVTEPIQDLEEPQRQDITD